MTFWHRGWGKCVLKMGPLNRPHHAVPPLRGCAPCFSAAPKVAVEGIFWVPGRGFIVFCPMASTVFTSPQLSRIYVSLSKPHPNISAKLRFYSGFRRDVLTPGVGEMCVENGPLEPATPCCSPAAGLRSMLFRCSE